MAEQEIQTQQVQVSSGGLEIAAYLAQPSTTGTFPGIVVLQEIFGVNSHIRDVTEWIAKQGYIAIAPALYQRQAPGFETGYTPEDIQIGREYKDKTKASELLGDIQAAINYLKNLPNVTGDRIGCIGFCFGGHVAYLAATLPDMKATSSFYGAGIATMTPGGGLPTVSRTGEIQGSLYAFFGDQDASIPPEEVQKIEAALKLHKIPHQVFHYPDADHGFFCDQRASYNSDAAQDAWGKVLELFETTLKAES
jgi:carboxymethylenebutenolidase